jgi:hypothetical protein
MGRFRISIGRLLVVIAHCGVAFAALRSPSWIWASTFFSLVFASMAVATLTAIYRLGSQRAFWTGYAICGWLYLGLSCLSWGSSTLSPLIITTALMDLAYPTIDRISGMGRVGPTTESIWQYWSQPPRSAGPFNWAVPEPYRAICHSIFTPILALLGGLLARRLHRTIPSSKMETTLQSGGQP